MIRPTFSVIIPTYNRADVLERTLQHLIEQDYPTTSFELLVASNSTDDTEARVQKLNEISEPDIRLIQSTERLPAIKRNQAMNAARGELVLYLNDDIWVSPRFLAEHARTHVLHKGEHIAVVGHVSQSPEMPHTPFSEWYRPFAYQELQGREDQAVPWWYFWSINISMPRAEALRGFAFHESWSEIGHEDVELGYRWITSGRRLFYNRKASGEHFHPHTLDSACRLQESIGKGLRDLELLCPEPWLLERYGVFSMRNRPRAILRGAARTALFNQLTTPAVKRWLETRKRNTPLTRWLYWKVLLHYTNRGYSRPARPEEGSAQPRPTRSTA
jgi:glycosyltransferase involved in cell wall biosynthesis